MTDIDLSELNNIGWTTVGNVRGDGGLLKIAKRLGNPITTKFGMVAMVVPKDRELAKPGTFGEKYGLGRYPLHSDTAHWSIPAKYLVLQASGDIRRNTTILSVRSLLSNLDDETKRLIKKSIWLSGSMHARFYCSILFTVEGLTGWRFDPMCMKPANESARMLQGKLFEKMESATPVEYCWECNSVLIIANWVTLHGRGSAPIDEGERKLFRVLVE